MSLYIASINSGSNGNCYYVGTEKEAVLIDAGISCRETEKRMKRLGLSMSLVKAIFVSHEHGDHITGVPALSKKYRLPVYITTPTLSNSLIPIEAELVKKFSPGEIISIGNLSVKPFVKFHDASDPHSFIVGDGKITVGVFTDLGIACETLAEHFSQCHAAFLEANYDTEMLEKGNYPYHLKKRISGGMGHLSNHQALELFLAHKPPFMSHLILSHLSRNNNDPALVEALFSRHKNHTQIVVASRYKESEVYHIKEPGTREASAGTARNRNTDIQLCLF